MTVLVLRGDSYKAVGELFSGLGYDVTYDASSLSEINLVVFTGGSDVSPYIYGEEPEGARGCDPHRDEFELAIWNDAKEKKIPCVGICRGGQLLNVLNGGEMIQDHGLISGDVKMIIFDDELMEMTVRVDHHQGMLCSGSGDYLSFNPTRDSEPEYEIWYPENQDLCVQYHPEWGHEGTKQRFISLLKRFL